MTEGTWGGASFRSPRTSGPQFHRRVEGTAGGSLKTGRPPEEDPGERVSHLSSSLGKRGGPVCRGGPGPRLAVHPAGQHRAPGPPHLPSMPSPRAPRSETRASGRLDPRWLPSHPPAPTHRSAGLRRVPAAPGLAAKVGRGGGRVVDVGQPLLGPARLLCPIRGTTEPRRGPEQRICKCRAGGVRGGEGLQAVSLGVLGAPQPSPVGLEQRPPIA